MQADRWLFAVTVLALCTRGAAAQARPLEAARSMQDTLPERVAQRTYEAFKRSDLDATYANYDSVFTYERFGDPAGSHQLRRDDYLRQVKADTAVVHIIKGLRIVLVRTECLALSSIRSGGSGSRMAESSSTSSCLKCAVARS